MIFNQRRGSNAVALPGFFENELEDEAAYTEFVIQNQQRPMPNEMS